MTKKTNSNIPAAAAAPAVAVIEIDIPTSGKPSSTGKSTVLYAYSGPVPNHERIRLSLSVYTKEGKTPVSAVQVRNAEGCGVSVNGRRVKIQLGLTDIRKSASGKTTLVATGNFLTPVGVININAFHK